MDDESDFSSAIIWANSETANRQRYEQSKKESSKRLTIIWYIIGFFIIIAVLLYIVYYAYTIPDPIDIIAEAQMISNQVPTSKGDDNQ